MLIGWRKTQNVYLNPLHHKYSWILGEQKDNKTTISRFVYFKYKASDIAS